MNRKHTFFLYSCSILVATFWVAIPAHSQYNRYGNSAYGNSGYGNSGYGNSYGSGYGNSGYGSSYGSGYGNSGYGNSSGYGSSYGNRSGYGSGSGSGYGNNYGSGSGYGNSSGNMSGRSSRRSSRSSRNRNSNSSGNYGGQIPNTADTQSGQAKQTGATGNSTDRRSALGGKTAARGALPGSSVAGKAASEKTATQGKQTSKKKDEVKTKPIATLYMETPSQVAVLNQPKLVSVVLANNKIEYDTISFTLQYDPEDLKPVSGQDASGEWMAAESIPIETDLSPSEDSDGTLLSKNPGKYEIVTNTIQDDTGEIRFVMKSKGGANTEGGELVHLNFLPLREAQTTISFVFNDPSDSGQKDSPLTAMTLNDADQLGSRFNQMDGVINLDLQIFQSLDKARERMVVKKAGERNDESIEEGESYNTELSLVPRQTSVDVGSVVEVDVVVKNPNKEVFDTVNLLIAYNPRIFEALDGDEFAPGINVDDQEYKEKFPLDFPILNSIDAEKGIVDYRKRSMRAPARGEGVLATLKFRAIRITQKTTFRLFINESGEEPTTGLFYRNKDRLGDPVDVYDGVNTCSLSIHPTAAYLKKIR